MNILIILLLYNNFLQIAPKKLVNFFLKWTQYLNSCVQSLVIITNITILQYHLLIICKISLDKILSSRYFVLITDSVIRLSVLALQIIVFVFLICCLENCVNCVQFVL